VRAKIKKSELSNVEFYKLGFQLTVRTQPLYDVPSICQSDYMFRPPPGHHQVTSTSHNRGS